jgi:hypothetical protein
MLRVGVLLKTRFASLGALRIVDQEMFVLLTHVEINFQRIVSTVFMLSVTERGALTNSKG